MMLYSGPSRIDGAPIMAWATGIASPSVNRKTGPMIQVWIMRRDVPPTVAVHAGDDKSICGGCRHRGINGAARTCYVVMARGPATVWKSADRDAPSPDLLRVAHLGGYRPWRIGAYGDPAAVPLEVWRALVSTAHSWTGYTHLWRSRLCRSAGWRELFMASVDSPEERDLAQARGWRTFRVRRPGDPHLPTETACPAESGKVTCLDCLTCRGTSGAFGSTPGIVIDVHGHGRRKFA